MTVPDVHAQPKGIVFLDGFRHAFVASASTYGRVTLVRAIVEVCG